MDSKIAIPDGSGSSALLEIEQGWVRVASELLRVAESGGEHELVEAVESFAQYVMFQSDDPEKGATC